MVCADGDVSTAALRREELQRRSCTTNTASRCRSSPGTGSNSCGCRCTDTIHSRNRRSDRCVWSLLPQAITPESATQPELSEARPLRSTPLCDGRIGSTAVRTSPFLVLCSLPQVAMQPPGKRLPARPAGGAAPLGAARGELGMGTGKNQPVVPGQRSLPLCTRTGVAGNARPRRLPLRPGGHPVPGGARLAASAAEVS